MDCVRPNCQAFISSVFTLVFDGRCPAVRKIIHLLQRWDRNRAFRFIECNQGSPKYLIDELDQSDWGLFLIDEEHVTWNGPEAIPIILKNLPFGKLAAVLYILPGTMWLTEGLYQQASRQRIRPLTGSTAPSM